MTRSLAVLGILMFLGGCGDEYGIAHERQDPCEHLFQPDGAFYDSGQEASAEIDSGIDSTPPSCECSCTYTAECQGISCETDAGAPMCCICPSECLVPTTCHQVTEADGDRGWCCYF